LSRKKIIEEINQVYDRIDAVIQYAHFNIAKKILIKAYNKSLSINYSLGINLYFEKIAIILLYTQYYTLSISIVKNLIVSYKKNQDTNRLIKMYNVLSVTLTKLSDFESSIYYLKKALKLSLNLNPIIPKRIVSIYLSLSFNYLEQEKYSQALENINLGLACFSNYKSLINSYIEFLHLNYHKIKILFNQNKINQAKEIFNILNRKHPLIGVKEEIIFELLELEFMLNEKEYDITIFEKQCFQLLEKTKKVKDAGGTLEIFSFLKRHYVILNDYVNALKYSKKIVDFYEQQPKQVSIIPIKENIINTSNSLNEDFILFYKQELEKASKYQTNFFTNKLESVNLNINTYFKSLKTVSADYLGNFKLDKDGNYYLFVLADGVSEGIAGTYISFLLDGIIKSIIYNSGSYNLKNIIKDINLILSDSLSGQGFVSLWAGIINTKNQTLESVNAGYLPSYLLKKDNTILNLKKGCTILGMFNELPNIESEILEFTNGDSLFAFSEGVKKSLNSLEYTFDGIIKNIIIEYSKNKAIDFNVLIERNIKEYKEFCQVEDDISYLVVDFKN